MNMTICCYVHYMDDTFVCFSSCNEALKFYQCQNNLHYSLSLTMEEENNNMLPFFDVLVEKSPSSFVNSVYRKPTFSGLYISWVSFTPKSRKMNVVKCLTHWTLMICSDSRIEVGLKKSLNFF